MYSTCLFCSASLGSNEVLESFPVGRRIAFDAARGRLWVVCRTCERWNLSPLEERWEVIDTCEQLFTDTRLRTSTENIGLAHLRAGLDLVRIGQPLRPEFAAWRYGDQFGRRRRRTMLRAGAGVSAVGLVFGGAQLAGLSLFSLVSLGQQLGTRIIYGSPNKEIASFYDNDGALIRFRRVHVESVRLLPRSGEGEDEWALEVPNGRRDISAQPVVLYGEAARRAAGPVLAAVNRWGGKARTVQDAVEMLERQADPAKFLVQMGKLTRDDNAPVIKALPEKTRLAIEMAVHEDVERRALEGELAELERAWREAEEIAGIADQLLLPDNIDERLGRLKG